MDGLLEAYQKHADHCLEMAERAPDDLMRGWFCGMARSFAMESRLMLNARSALSESRELLERANDLLARRRSGVRSHLPVAPSRATDAPDQRT
jgi:hypothetical protein